MTNNQETIKKTKSFGLNTYEAKIWAALLSRRTATAGDLSDIANVPRSRSYDVLESLEKKGFVVMKLGKPIKYLAAPPKEVLERVKNQVEKKTQNHLSTIKSASFSNLIKKFQELYEKNTNHKDNIVAVLRGKANIHKHLGFLFRDAKKDILFSVEAGTEEHQQIINEAKEKPKTTIKSSDMGLRMCVVGEDDALIFPLSKQEVHPDYDLCIWIRNKHTAKFLKQLLTFVWLIQKPRMATQLKMSLTQMPLGQSEYGFFNRTQGTTRYTIISNIKLAKPIPVSYINLPKYDKISPHGKPLRLNKQERTLVDDMFGGDEEAIKKRGFVTGVHMFTDPVNNKPEQIETLVYFLVTDIEGNRLNSISTYPRIINRDFVQNNCKEQTTDRYEALQNHRKWENIMLGDLEGFRQEADKGLVGKIRDYFSQLTLPTPKKFTRVLANI